MSSFAIKDSVCWNIVSAGIGSNSMVELVEGVHPGTDGYSSRPINRYSGTFSLSYRRYLSKRVSLGIAIAFENESGDMIARIASGQGANTTEKRGIFKRKVYSIVPEVYLNYREATSPLIHPYGYLGIGYTLLNELDNYDATYYNTQFHNGMNRLGPSAQQVSNRCFITTQACLLGLSFGRRLRAFTEIGFGYKGIINGGALLSL